MPQQIYLWHPIFVHFTLALLCASVLFYLAARLVDNPDWRQRLVAAAELNLWVGTALTVLTVGFGWLAFESVPHEDSAHEAMQLHRNLALATFGWFAALTLFASWHRRGAHYPSIPFMIALLIGLGGLTLTGMRGGELVFEHGLAVAKVPTREMRVTPGKNAAPQPGHEGHSHSH